MTYQSVTFDAATPVVALAAGIRSHTAGMLVRRPDLLDEAVLESIADRLAFEGRDPAHAPGVLKAAMEGRHAAKAFMRKLVLPAPRSTLAMPIQSILPEKIEHQVSGSWFRRASLGR